MTAALATVPWMHAHSGRSVPLINTPPDAISIRDIAAHLSKICRFAGATQSFYSVAQHSILVSNFMAEWGPRGQLYGLLHDAHEAYTGDIPQPVKDLMSAALGMGATPFPLTDLVSDLDAAIHARCGLAYPVPADIRAAIHHADMRALATERRDLLSDGADWCRDLPAPWRAVIKPWPWPKAEEKFLQMFDEKALLAGLPAGVGR